MIFTFVDNVVGVEIDKCLQKFLKVSSSGLKLDTSCNVDKRLQRGHVD